MHGGCAPHACDWCMPTPVARALPGQHTQHARARERLHDTGCAAHSRAARRRRAWLPPQLGSPRGEWVRRRPQEGGRQHRQHACKHCYAACHAVRQGARHAPRCPGPHPGTPHGDLGAYALLGRVGNMPALTSFFVGHAAPGWAPHMHAPAWRYDRPPRCRPRAGRRTHPIASPRHPLNPACPSRGSPLGPGGRLPWPPRPCAFWRLPSRALGLGLNACAMPSRRGGAASGVVWVRSGPAPGPLHGA